MVKRIMEFLEEKVVPISAKVSGNKNVIALTKTFQSIIPIVTVGSVFLLLSRPLINPINLSEGTFIYSVMSRWETLVKLYGAPLKIAANLTIGSIGLYVSLGISYFISEEYEINQLVSVFTTFASFVILSSIKVEDIGISINNFGGTGIFTGMIVAFFTTGLIKFMKDRGIGHVKLPETVPPVVSTSLSSILPVFFNIFISIVVSIFIQTVIGVTFPDLLVTLLTPVLAPINGLVGISIFIVLSALSFWFGVHSDTIWALLKPLLYSNLAINAEAYMNGTSLIDLPTIATTSFAYNFTAIGGAGATFGLAILLLRSKSKELKALGKIAFLPSLFNINEPIIFGVPIMLNPIFLIPFIGAQLMNGIVAYGAMYFKLINRTYMYGGTTMPVGLPNFLTTLDWRAVILVAILVIMDILIYLPFFKVYEQRKVEEESKLAL